MFGFNVTYSQREAVVTTTKGDVSREVDYRTSDEEFIKKIMKEGIRGIMHGSHVWVAPSMIQMVRFR